MKRSRGITYQDSLDNEDLKSSGARYFFHTTTDWGRRLLKEPLSLPLLPPGGEVPH
jgi:hypothetical protein